MGFNFTVVWSTGDSKEGGYVVLAEDSTNTYFATVTVQGRVYATNSFGTLNGAINFVRENLHFFTRDVEE